MGQAEGHLCSFAPSPAGHPLLGDSPGQVNLPVGPSVSLKGVALKEPAQSMGEGSPEMDPEDDNCGTGGHLGLGSGYSSFLFFKIFIY